MAGFSRSRTGSRLVLFGVVLCSGTTLSAQSRVAGRVVHLERGDTLPAGGVPVVLHRVARSRQGPVDTVRADARGRFAFRFRPDTTAAYLLSVRYDGIEYFSKAVASNPARSDTAVIIIVADTSSVAPVSTHERTLLIGRADESGTRTVVDWFVLLNAGERTRVADSLHPSWSAALPPDAQNVELADARLSLFSTEALEFRNDSALVFAPLSPGQKELVLQYRIPGSLRSLSVPQPAGIDSLFVLLEESGARVVAPVLAVSDSQTLDGRVFRRWAGKPGGAPTLVITFPKPPVSTRIVLWLLVALAAAGFAALALVRRRRREPLSSTPHPVYLADAIARLDAAELDRGAEASAEERDRYRTERARLAEALSRALAAARRRS